MTYGLKNTIYDWRAGNANGRTQTYKRKKMKDRTHPSSHQGAVGLVTPAWLDLAWPGLTWGVVSLRDSRLFSFVVFFFFLVVYWKSLFIFFPVFFSNRGRENRIFRCDFASHWEVRSVRPSVGPVLFLNAEKRVFWGWKCYREQWGAFYVPRRSTLVFSFFNKTRFFFAGMIFFPGRRGLRMSFKTLRLKTVALIWRKFFEERWQNLFH